MTRIGPSFDMGDVTRLADGTALYSVYVNGKAPLNGGGANGVPAGRYIGRVWSQEPYGWVAAPLAMAGAGADSWQAEVQRSVRHFKTRKDACLFLYGHVMGVGAVKLADTLAAMPWGKSGADA